MQIASRHVHLQGVCLVIATTAQFLQDGLIISRCLLSERHRTENEGQGPGRKVKAEIQSCSLHSYFLLRTMRPLLAPILLALGTKSVALFAAPITSLSLLSHRSTLPSPPLSKGRSCPHL